ncbi:MAG: DNA primase [Oscillospiraceae bacterium]|nr:DNA primase [Oscillospiraceae bacterium]
MPFPESFLEELAARNDIVDVVGDYVSFTKKSGANQFGLCPFHGEKTPSFSVHSDKQIYYCFGCHKGGGVVSFIMEIEGLPFPDAVHFLARRAGMTVPDEGGYDEAVQRRTRLLQANKEAARFFHAKLSEPDGKAAIDYINKRGISKEMTKQFGLGAAPDSWNALTDHLVKRGYSQEELLLAGLVRRSSKSGGVYDFFRDRLVFPVIDVRGNVLAFSGRILGDGEPKYLNTSDTPVYNKKRNLFGINLARKSRAEHFLIVEGNIDVVALHGAGFDSAIAPLGTALTQEQATLLHRYKGEAVLAFDADTAGQRATETASKILEKTGIRVKVLRIPDGKDPDDFIKKKGPGAFQALLDQRETHIEYRLLTLKQTHDLESDPGRVAYLQEAQKLLASLESDVEVEVYGQRVATETGVSAEGIKSGIKKLRDQKRKQAKRDMEKAGTRPSQSMQPKERTLRYTNPASAKAEEGVLRLLLQDPTLYNEALPLQPEDFSSPFLGRAYEVIRDRIRAGRENTAATLAPLFSSQEMGHLIHLLNQPEDPAETKQALSDYIGKIQAEKRKQNPEANLLDIYKLQ